MVVAVEETAAATGKTASGETRARRRGAFRAPVVTAAAALFSVVPMLAFAQIAPTPGTSTHVVQTPNGLPQVNIAAPSGAGVSVNTYQQFDVQKPGAILNNSATLVNTQQAGMINGNPNFGRDQSARIIVNQVNSANPSQLRGYVEVAGRRAEVVVANPSGIVVNGGGFINTSRATLTTGQPYYGVDGSLGGYNVNRGNITVEGAGLNAANVDQVDLTARAVRANAALYANNLHIIAGANQVRHDTLAATAIAGDGAAPMIAIDVSQLGGMYANRMFLVSNEYGVGVNNAGILAAQAGDMTLHANGQLVLSGTTNASGNLSATAHAIQNSGITYAQQSAHLSASGAFSNSGTLAAQQHVNVSAGSVASSGNLGAGVNADGIVSQPGDLMLNASGQLSAHGQNLTGGNLSFTGSGINLSGSQTAANANVSLHAQAGDLNLTGTTTSAQRALDVSASGTIRNDRGTLSSQAGTTMRGGSVSNQDGQISSGGPLTIEAAAQLDNQRGTLVTDGALQLNAGDAIANREGTMQSVGALLASSASFDNTAGRVVSLSADGLVLNTQGQLRNAGGLTATGVSGGVIGGNGNVTIQAGALANHESVTAQRDLRVIAGSLDNNGGKLAARGNATVDAGDNLSNAAGHITADQMVSVRAVTIDNNLGTIDATQLILSATDLTNQQGMISHWGGAPMTVAVSGTLDNTQGGVLQTNSTALQFTPMVLNNAGGIITHGGTGQLTLAPGNGASALANTAGTIVTQGQLDANASRFDNTHGTVFAQRGIIGTIAGDLDNTQGVIQSAAALSLTLGGTFVNRDGHLQAGQALADDTLLLAADTIDNTAGAITNLSLGQTSVQASRQIVNAAGDPRTEGLGKITGHGAVKLRAPSIINTQGGQFSGARMDIEGATLDNSDGQIGNLTGNGDVNVALTGALTNTHGQLGAAHDLTVATAALLGGGTYSAARDMHIALAGDATTTSDLALNAGRDLTLRLPGTLDHQGSLLAVEQLRIDAGTLINRGTMTAGDRLDAHAGKLTNMGALIGANVTLTADDTVTNTGPSALIGGSDSTGLLEILAPNIVNRDPVTATDTLAQTAIFGLGNIVLAGGKTADGHYTNAAQISNESALIQSDGDLALHANQVTNTRRQMQTSGYTGNVDAALLEQLGISMSGRTGQIGVADPDSIGGVFIDPPHGGQWNSTYQYTTYTGEAVANTVTALSPAAQMVAGGNLDAQTTGLLQNYWSSITAAGDIALPARYDANSWQAQQAPGVIVTYSGQYHYNNYDNSEHDWQLPFGDAPFVGSRPGGYTQKGPADIRDYALPGYESRLSANGTISGNGVELDNAAGNATIPSLGLKPGQPVPLLSDGKLDGQAPEPVDPVIASATALDVLHNLTLPQGGLFRPNPAPDAPYLIETNPAFTNQKPFLSSDYYLEQLGLNPGQTAKRLGDGFYEQQLVRNQVTALTGKAVLGPYTNLETMYETLLGAGASLAKSLDLPLGVSLSAQQVAQLTGNLILMETRMVDGQPVLVPVVYLAQAEQQNLGNGPVIAATDIDLKNTRTFVNSGTMRASNRLSVDGQSLDNRYGTLHSGGQMASMMQRDVDLTSANVRAGSLQLQAGNDLILDTAVKTRRQVNADGACAKARRSRDRRASMSAAMRRS